MLRMLMYDDNTKTEQGAWGEQIVNSLINLKGLREKERYLFKDVYIQDKHGVHQIDHIFVMENGIHVVETKMLTGKVKGTTTDPFWFGFIGGHMTQFLNPLKQNESHVEAVKSVLGSKYILHSLVVFPNCNKPKECKSTNVMNLDEFRNYLLDFESRKELTSDDMLFIKQALSELSLKKAELKKKHIEMLKMQKLKHI